MQQRHQQQLQLKILHNNNNIATMEKLQLLLLPLVLSRLSPLRLQLALGAP
jgi:hypothetical protein